VRGAASIPGIGQEASLDARLDGTGVNDPVHGYETFKDDRNRRGTEQVCPVV